jgi:hypothetical protein
MMNELPIVGRDQRRVGYYSGITVRLISFFFESFDLTKCETGICILRRRSGHRTPLEPPF